MPVVVQLYVYDISKGAARALSSMLIGKQIDGIWHTGLVCFGKEYFFGSGGIESIFPGTTVLGRPDEVVTLGETQITEEVFNEYLFEIYPQFSPGKYHLFDHNCNTFSDEASQFLTGKKIPSYIQDLPMEVLSTDFGSMLRDIFESAVASPSADGVIQRFLGNEEQGANNQQTSGGMNQSVANPVDMASTVTQSRKSENFRPKPDSQAVTFSAEYDSAMNMIKEHLPDVEQAVEKTENSVILLKDEARDSVLTQIGTLLNEGQDSKTTEKAVTLLTSLTQHDPCLLVDSATGVACLQKILSRCSDASFDPLSVLKLLTNVSSSVASRKLLNNAGSSSAVMTHVLSFCASQLLNETREDCMKAAIAGAHNSTFGNVPGDSALEISSALLHLITNSNLDEQSAGLARRAVVNLCRQNPEVIELANMMDFKPDSS